MTDLTQISLSGLAVGFVFAAPVLTASALAASYAGWHWRTYPKDWLQTVVALLFAFALACSGVMHIMREAAL